MTNVKDLLTLAQAAEEIGSSYPITHRAVKKFKVEPVLIAGTTRLFARKQLPAIKKAVDANDPRAHVRRGV